VKIQQLTVIGVGLIGGSFARATRKANKVETIVGCGRNEANLIKAVELGVIDSYKLDVKEAVKNADLVMLAVPLGAMTALFEQMKEALKTDAVITDAGSVKSSVINSIKTVYGEVPPHFIPGHPIAGTEESGVEASFDTLYNDRRVILTPLDNVDESALSLVKECWESAGAEVSTMSVEHHDEVLAATSHLPHMLAFGLVDTLAQQDEQKEIFKYAAGGFRDFTRIASSNPVMWRDICIANHEALSDKLDAFATEMTELADAIREQNADELLDIFTRAKTARDKFIG